MRSELIQQSGNNKITIQVLSLETELFLKNILTREWHSIQEEDISITEHHQDAFGKLSEACSNINQREEQQLLRD